MFADFSQATKMLMHLQYMKVGIPNHNIFENIVREIHENGQSAKILALENYPL